jgi:hypothetical protein
VFIGAAYYTSLCRDCFPRRRYPNNIWKRFKMVLVLV